MSKIKRLSPADDRLFFNCPGCNEEHAVNTTWQFNNDDDKPTFSPSILVTGWKPNKDIGEPFTCHSFIKDGKIQFLSDCTHSLANQTVDLIDYKTPAIKLNNRKMSGPMCKVITVDGKHFVITPDGYKLPYQIMTRVTDDIHQSPCALVKLFVELEDSTTEPKTYINE